MNAMAACLARHGDSTPYAYLGLTPRFRASRHVVFLALAPGATEPSLVAKLPRAAADTAAIAHEATNLQRIAAALPGPRPGVPRLVTLDLAGEWPMLIQSAVPGRALDRATVRRDPERWCALADAWLAALATGGPPHRGAQSLRQVLDDLDHLAGLARLDAATARLIERTRPLLTPLGTWDLPRTVEHGDFSAPNVLVQPDGQLGAVDWELAEPDGLPIRDMAFFLTYVAIARRRLRSVADHVAAFDAAFFGPDAWARRWLHAHARRLGVPEPAVAPLFLATWTRYVAGLWARLRAVLDPAERRAWVRDNRYHAFWGQAVARLEGPGWDG